MRYKLYKVILITVIVIIALFQITALAADNFSSGGTVAPEKDVYYVGDTVNISDFFKNKSTNNATGVSVEYYYRLNGANSVYSGSPINLGTIAAGASENHAFNYTFKESDIGDYRIGAKITYTIGGTTESEYSSGHDFVVEAAPSATPEATFTPEPTFTPTPEATIEPAPTEAEEDTPQNDVELLTTFTPEPESIETAQADDAETDGGLLQNMFNDKGIVIALIIITGAILALLLILLIIIVSKKK